MPRTRRHRGAAGAFNDEAEPPMPTARNSNEARAPHHPSKVTPVGKTPHFEVSYLTTLSKKGDTLARAILHNCERDYAALKKFFGGLTPKRLPFVVQVTA